MSLAGRIRRSYKEEPQIELFAPQPSVRRRMTVDEAEAGQQDPEALKKAALQRGFDAQALVHSMGLHYTDWSRDLPPLTGWYDTRTGDEPPVRLWFVRIDDPVGDDNDGCWFIEPTNISADQWHSQQPGVANKGMGWHSTYRNTLSWRGLTTPWPDGYPYFVPGATSNRNRITYTE